MDGSLRRDRIPHFLLLVLMIFSGFLAPVSAALKSGTWQEMNTSNDAINGTVPLADGVTIPVYQGSILLSPDETHAVNFSAMPRDFSTDDTGAVDQSVQAAKGCDSCSHCGLGGLFVADVSNREMGIAAKRAGLGRNGLGI